MKKTAIRILLTCLLACGVTLTKTKPAAAFGKTFYACVWFTNQSKNPVTLSTEAISGSGQWAAPYDCGSSFANNVPSGTVASGQSVVFGMAWNGGIFSTSGFSTTVFVNGTANGMYVSVPWSYFNGVGGSCGGSGSGIVQGGSNGAGTDTCSYSFGVTDPQGEATQGINVGVGPALTTVTPQGGYDYQNGALPSVAVDQQNTWYEVHEGSNGEMWYVRGNKTFASNVGGRYQTYGFVPSVSTQGTGRVIEVHQGGPQAGPLWYLQGADNAGGGVNWQSALQYDSGANPTVGAKAECEDQGGIVVEEHQGASGPSNLWYNVTKYSNSQSRLTWTGARQYDYGEYPALAVDSFGTVDPYSCGFVVVEVHQGGDGIGPLWYKIGIVNSVNDTVVNWYTPQQYASAGEHPTVAVFTTYTGTMVLESHAGNGDGSLWYMVGNVDFGSHTIHWIGSPQHWDNGGNRSAIAVGGDTRSGGLVTGVEVHQGSNTFGAAMWADPFKITHP